jgi:hypothetical protein
MLLSNLLSSFGGRGVVRSSRRSFTRFVFVACFRSHVAASCFARCVCGAVAPCARGVVVRRSGAGWSVSVPVVL